MALGSPSLPPAEAEEQVPPCRSLPEALLVPTRPFKKVDVKFTWRDRNRVEEKIQAPGTFPRLSAAREPNSKMFSSPQKETLPPLSINFPSLPPALNSGHHGSAFCLYRFP